MDEGIELPYDLIWKGEYDRTDPEVSFQRGEVAFKHRDFGRAITEFNHAIMLKPDYGLAWLKKGNCYKAVGAYANAIESYENASPHVSNKDLPIGLIGSVHDLEKNYEEAVRHYSQAIEINPFEVGWYIFRGDARMKLKHYSLVFFDLTKVLEMKKEGEVVFPFYKKRGIARMRLKDYTGAVEDLTYSISLNPKMDAEAFYYRGFSYQRLNNIEQGDLDMKVAFENGITSAQKYISTNKKDDTI